MHFKRSVITFIFIAIWCASSYAQSKYSFNEKSRTIEITSNGVSYRFNCDFTVLYSAKNPDMALRPAGLKGVSYNVPTWKTYAGKESNLNQTVTAESVAGDGFDDKILKSAQDGRTVSINNAAASTVLSPIGTSKVKDGINISYKSNALFELTAKVILSASKQPALAFTLKPKVNGYFSVGYTGAPAFSPTAVKEIWQPLIWQEMRYPDKAYLTTAHMCPVPTTLVNDGKNTLGVMASPAYLPFNPLPLVTNSQFGVGLRNDQGKAQNTVYAPILGGFNSEMKAGSSFNFMVYLIVEPSSITKTYEKIAKTFFGFKDYRKNDISTLNQTLDNIVDYSLSKYALFVDSLKGCAYSTDVPGAVKNVSSLNPIELAMVMDNQTMFDKRGYPLLEYMLSREKFLFSLDSTQKIQSPSRKLQGPVAPLSELVTLYNAFNKKNQLFVKLAEQEYTKTRERNLDVKEKGVNWMNAMHLYNATGDKSYLTAAIAGADSYLKTRVNQMQTSFSDKMAGNLFFWPTFTNKWIDLLRLYEITKDKKYLTAAQDGARHYTMFTYMTPAIPDTEVTVNKDGKAPMYWYLQGKGHKQMYYPEEKAPAWRLSEIGLTPESSGTSAGHRAIFMANYAPWMLKLGYYANDPYLMNVAKAAIIGRSKNFPGYHINTERTTAYEKLDFPLHDHLDQSVNSFHYNHILPMASMLLDYLVTDVFVRSNGGINFPAEFIEGYAYLQSSFYGSKAGSFYDVKDVKLWMPAGLVKTSDVELNYISARKANNLYIAFTNQSKQLVNSKITLNPSLVQMLAGNATLSIYKNGTWQKVQKLTDLSFNTTVAANGITVVRIENVSPKVNFQDQLIANLPSVKNDEASFTIGGAKAFSFRLGNVSKAYVYLQDDDTKLNEASLSYTLKNGKEVTLRDTTYPFEFTIDLPNGENQLSLKLTAIQKNGKKISSSPVTLGN